MSDENVLIVDDLRVGPNMVRNWLKQIEELEQEIDGLKSEISIARSDGRIYAGESKIDQLKQILKDVRPFDAVVKNQACWCSSESSTCLTTTCISARQALGLPL